MTQRDLARGCNIEEATISRYVHGLRPTPDHAARMAEVLAPTMDGAA